MARFRLFGSFSPLGAFRSFRPAKAAEDGADPERTAPMTSDEPVGFADVRLSAADSALSAASTAPAGAEPAAPSDPLALSGEPSRGGADASGESAGRRKGRPSLRPKHLLGLAAAGVLAVFLAVGVHWAVEFAETSDYFRITRLEMQGDVQKVPLARVKEVVEGVMNGNYFTADLAPVREAVLTVPWVKDASVRRVWPDGIAVSVDVYDALALYEDGRLVSREGVLFSANPEEDPNAEDLPNFYGAPSEVAAIARRYRRFSRIVSVIPADITDVILSDRGSWAIVMQSDSIPPTKIELGQEKLDARMGFPEVEAQKELSAAAEEIASDALFKPEGLAEERLDRIAKSYGLLTKLMKGPPSSIDARYSRAIAAGAPDQKALKAYLETVEKRRKLEEDQNSPVYNPEPDGDDAAEADDPSAAAEAAAS